MTPHALLAPARLAGAPLLRTQSDERLVDLVRAGNDGAFEAIVARYRRPLLRYCSGLMPEGRAEDVVQQAFLRAYDALRGSASEMSLQPWLYRIAHNCSLNALRDRALNHEQLSEGIDGVERPDQAFEKHERLRETVAAVRALPERQRNAIVLRELEGRSYEEIAAQLGVTGGAVRQLLNRARTTLRGGMTAVTPFGLLARIPWAPGGGGMATRVAEMCTAGGGTVLVKVCATAIVTGAVVGGVATTPSVGPGDGRASTPGTQDAAAAAPGDGVSGNSGTAGSRGVTAGEDRRGVGPGRRGSDHAGRGPKDGDRGPGDDHGGTGHGGDGSDGDRGGGSGGRRGPGGGDERPDGPSGPGGEDGGGSGSGESGSGVSGTGESGSGSGESGSGSAESGSGSSGSGGEPVGEGSSEPDPPDGGEPVVTEGASDVLPHLDE